MVLKRYLPPEQVDQIIAGEADFEQEPSAITCTILFSDLAGFTTLSEQLGAIQISEETKALIEDAFAVGQRGKVTMKGKGELMTSLLLGTCEQS